MAFPKSRFRSRGAVQLAAAVALTVCLSACAAVVRPALDPRCEAVSELPDGSWRVLRPMLFGRTVRVESGATLHDREVIDGIDLGAVLDRQCRDPSFHAGSPVLRF